MSGPSLAQPGAAADDCNTNRRYFNGPAPTPPQPPQPCHGAGAI